MDKKTLIEYIESSFIKDILTDIDITDISYNGRDIYYVTNLNGRSRSAVSITQNEAKDFIRNIANLSEKQFNYLHPILDVNIGRYRINATFSSVSRLVDEECITFSIRIASYTPKIKDDHKFMVEEVESLFKLLILNHISIVISGVPGTGKTEFQKYLISLINENERVIIIDSTIELASLQLGNLKDITIWQADENNKEASITNLIKNGLRNNPDWMIVSEARGEEMNDVLLSALTGVPIITTIHSLDALSAPIKMAKSIMLNDKKINYEDVVSNIKEHFRVYVHLKKYIDKNNHIVRYISSIVNVDESGELVEIYHDALKDKIFAKLSKNIPISIINKDIMSKLGRFI